MKYILLIFLNNESFTVLVVVQFSRMRRTSLSLFGYMFANDVV